MCCGTAAQGPSGELRVEPTVLERQMLEVQSRGTEAPSPILAALSVGGPRDPGEVARMAAALDARLSALLVGLPLDPVARGRAVLTLLFSPRGGSPLLAHYEADATTLSEILASGRYNCVSATMLYILAARRVGVDARPVLLPSHARARVVAGERAFVVETTTKEGFDPPPAVSRATLDRARPRSTRPHVDLYADERGTEVNWNALLGIAYGNLGIMAEARGETALAAALFGREATLTPAAQLPLVKAEEASLLTELATGALAKGQFGEAMALGLRAEAAAPDARMKALTVQNLAAIGSQELAARAASMDDATLLAYADPLKPYPEAYGDVRALVLTKVAERRLARGDVLGSSSLLREAAGLAKSDEVRGATAHNARLGELNRIGRLSATDPERAWSEWQSLGPGDPALADTETALVAAISENRAVRFANDGKCAELEKVLAGAAVMTRADALRAGCHARVGLRLSDHGDFAGAMGELRSAMRLDPAETRHKQNLAVVLEKQIDALIHSNRCKEIPPLVREGRTLDPSASFFDEATLFCKRM